MSAPNISVRKHWRWVPDEPVEPTSTLVLTSFNSYFLDIRIYNSIGPDGVPEPLPNTGGPLGKLQWAFAGTSQTTEADNERPAHTVWAHWIDSKTDDPEVDEGDMFAQENGDTLERWHTVHPDTGLMCEYEELWQDVVIESTNTERAIISVVLKADVPELSTRGIIIRVGGWCQGLLKVKDHITIERWKLATTTVSKTTEVKEEHDDVFAVKGPDSRDWERIAQLGDHYVPCIATFDLDKLGKSVKFGDVTWEVVEKYQK